MPALSTLAFVGNHADANITVVNASNANVLDLKVPGTPEAIAAEASTDMVTHQTVTVPTGFFYLINNHQNDISGTFQSIVDLKLLAAGAWANFTVSVLNHNVSGQTATADTIMAQTMLIPYIEHYGTTW